MEQKCFNQPALIVSGLLPPFDLVISFNGNSHFADKMYENLVWVNGKHGFLGCMMLIHPDGA